MLETRRGLRRCLSIQSSWWRHSRLKSTNLIERLNQEVRRREKVIRIFPNVASANRLIVAVLIDRHEEWISSSRKYIQF